MIANEETLYTFISLYYVYASYRDQIMGEINLLLRNTYSSILKSSCHALWYGTPDNNGCRWTGTKYSQGYDQQPPRWISSDYGAI